MLTTDDLKKLRDVIHEEISGSESKVRGEITSLETKMEHRFNAVDKRFDTVDIRFEKLEKQMEQDRHDWSNFFIFNGAGIFFDEMRSQLVKRITKLEENQRLSNN